MAARTTLVAGILWAFATMANAGPLPLDNPVPGGIAVVDIGAQTELAPRVFFGQQEISLVANNARWIALVGLAQATVPGRYILRISTPEAEPVTRSFRIFPLRDAKPKKTIQLPDELAALSFPELDLNPLGSLRDFSDYVSADFNSDFALQQIVTSGRYIPYGTIVLPGNQSNELVNHPWVTYVTDAEALVQSPGTVLVDQIFLDDNDRLSIVLGHGSNLHSIISNIQETVLKPGEMLAAGDLIGTTGPSSINDFGRVDWRIILNGNLIDPLQFTADAGN